MSLSNVQSRVYDFLQSANGHLDEKNALFYNGQCATGQIENPDILFISINPGYGERWDDRQKKFDFTEYRVSQCKFIDQYEDIENRKLAARIVDVLLNGKVEYLNRCAETYITSIFNTPNTEVLYASLNELGRLAPELRKDHDELSNEIIKLIQPKHIVCIGMTAFREYLNRFGKNGYAEIQMKDSLSKSKKSRPVHLKKTVVNGIPVYGVLHLSGAQISNEALNDLKEEFRDLF